MKMGEQARPFKPLKGLTERLIIIYFSSLHKSSWNEERKEAQIPYQSMKGHYFQSKSNS